MHPLVLIFFGRMTIRSLAQTSAAVVPLAEPQLNTYNHGADVESAVQSAGFDGPSVRSIQTALDFERSNWAGGFSVSDDPFYQLPHSGSSAEPGAVLKVEQGTNVSRYTLPPKVALSRFLYNTQDFNGTVIPNSAFVLWPWMPKKTESSGIPVVAWAHGTSGFSPECAPSHIQNLWYHFTAPYTLALQGYAVVAPDYAGLGVGKDAKNIPLTHQYGANPAAANDVIHAVQAAQQAWPKTLSKEWVVFGHSQGGGAAWAVAQREVTLNDSGFLGTVAASPVTDFSQYINNPIVNRPPYQEAFSAVAATVASIFPTFETSTWLTPSGIERFNLLQTLRGCQSVALELYASAADFIKPEWTDNWYFQAFSRLASNGGRQFAQPMLVLQGIGDPIIANTLTDHAVNKTCTRYPDSALQYYTFEQTSHVPVMYESQQIWLRWIEDRFNGRPVRNECTAKTFHSILPNENYGAEVNFFLEYPQYAYETA